MVERRSGLAPRCHDLGSSHVALPVVEVELVGHLHAASMLAMMTMLVLMLMLMMSASSDSEAAMC